MTDGLEVITPADAAAFEAWLDGHHADRPGVWLRIAKKGAAATTVTASDAIDVVLCFGWIDSLRRSLDETYFLQKYTPRRPKGYWSRVNIERVEALTAAGRMRPAGLAEVAAAKADGRWDAAYDRQATATVPADLAAALAQSPAAREAFDALGRTDRYLVILHLQKARRPQTRAARLASVVAGLAAGDPVP